MIDQYAYRTSTLNQLILESAASVYTIRASRFSEFLLFTVYGTNCKDYGTSPNKKIGCLIDSRNILRRQAITIMYIMRLIDGKYG